MEALSRRIARARLRRMARPREIADRLCSFLHTVDDLSPVLLPERLGGRRRFTLGGVAQSGLQLFVSQRFGAIALVHVSGRRLAGVAICLSPRRRDVPVFAAEVGVEGDRLRGYIDLLQDGPRAASLDEACLVNTPLRFKAHGPVEAWRRPLSSPHTLGLGLNVADIEPVTEGVMSTLASYLRHPLTQSPEGGALRSKGVRVEVAAWIEASPLTQALALGAKRPFLSALSEAMVEE